MPTGAGNGEEISVVVDIAEDVEGRVVLEEEIHLDTDAANVLEHVGELHMLGIRAEAIEARKTKSVLAQVLIHV